MLTQESFLTTRGGWKLGDGDDEYVPYVQDLQDKFLDKQYLDTSPFENISATECIHRYQMSFIRAGNLVAVVAKNHSEGSDRTDNSSLKYFKMDVTEMFFGPKVISDLSCKFVQTGSYVSHLYVCRLLE